MVARAGKYYGDPFKVYHRVNKGDSLSTTIFNMVVYAVIRHWMMVVVVEEA